jgi:hypothetical protein
MQFDGLCLQVEATLTPLRLTPLGSRGLLEHGGPQLEALVLVGEIPVFPVQHTLHLRAVLTALSRETSPGAW